jgi:methionyl-tRNA formyltransferase
MKIIFFGSGHFAVNILESLHKAGHAISKVVTQPDRSSGRHLKLAKTPVKDWALSNNLCVFQPESVNEEQNVEILKNENPDFFVVASYGQILSKQALGLPKIMPINVHGSLLPKYRGAAPIARALINGETKTGITFIRMNERMDQGDILFKKTISIDKKDNSVLLDEKLSKLAAQYVSNVLEKSAQGKLKFIKQSNKSATYAPLMKKEDGCIRWNSSALQVYNAFRGSFGWPGSFTFYRSRLLKIFDMELGCGKIKGAPGEIISACEDVLEVACKTGFIRIREVLPESHKRMSTRSFLVGHKVKPGDFLGTEIPLQEL